MQCGKLKQVLSQSGIKKIKYLTFEIFFSPYSKFNLAKLIKAGLCTHISPAPFFNYHKNNGSFAVLADLEKCI